jgi:hypothetical protein
MPAIQVARTDTFEIQRQKINQIGDQIFSISQGGSDLATGNLKIGDGAISSPSLAFASETTLGLYKSGLGNFTFVSDEKRVSSIANSGTIFYKDISLQKNILQTSGVLISAVGSNYDSGTYTDVPILGGSGTGATFDFTVVGFTGSTTNSGSGYISGNYFGVPLIGGSGSNATIAFIVSDIDGSLIDGGSNYDDNFFNNVPATGGSGNGLTFNFSVANGEAQGVTIASPGSGYVDGDILSVDPNFDGVGAGSGFQYEITQTPGDITGENISDYGSGYQPGDVLSLPQSVNNISTTLDTLNTQITVSSTAGIFQGSIVTKSSGVGDIDSDTTVQAVIDSTTLELSVAPTVDGPAVLNFEPPFGGNPTSSYQYTISQAGIVSSISVNNPGNGYADSDSLTVNPSDLTQPITYVVGSVDVDVITFTTPVSSSVFSVGDEIQITGGGVSGSNITASTALLTEQGNIYSGVASTGGSGSGATFDVSRSFDGSVISANISSPGIQYQINDVLTISGSLVGGSSPTDDITLEVTTVEPYGQGLEIYSVSTTGGNISSLTVFSGPLTSSNIINKVGVQGITYTIDTSSQERRYTFDSGSGIQVAPSLTLYSGNKYVFDMSNASSHPLYFSTFRDGKWSPSLVENVSTILDALSPLITVSSTSGILPGMLVSAASGIGSLGFGITVEEVVDATTIRLSDNPEISGQSILTFSGAPYNEGVSRDANNVYFNPGTSTPSTLYYYCNVHPNMGGLDNLESTITVDQNNPKTFGSGFVAIATAVLSQTTIESNLVDGKLTVLELESDDIVSSSAIIPNLTSSSINNTNLIGTNLINSPSNIDISAPSVSISDDLNVGSNLTIVGSSGNLTTAGILRTNSSLNVNNECVIQNNEVRSVASNLVLKPASNQSVKVDTSTALIIPVGTDAEKTLPSISVDGAIRYNTTTQQYEGYSINPVSLAGSWSSLGGVRDIDGNTYILAELTAGANDNTLWFYNDNVNTLKLTTQFLDFRSVKKISSGRLGLPAFTLWSANTAVVIGQYIKYRNNLYEVTASGTTATSGNEPSHTSGVANNGTAQLTWYSSAVSPLEFTEIEELRVAPNKDAPLIVNQSIKIGGKEPADWNTISTLIEDLVLAPNSGKKVVVDCSTSLVVPVGNTNQRESAAQGSIRYNTTISQFEGYSGANWSSLGGVRDVNGNTYIIPETSPGADENILYFYNDNVNTLQVTTTELDFTNLDTITTSGGNSLALNTEIVTLDNSATTIDNTDSTSSFISTTKQYLDLGLSSGLNVDPVLRLDDQGDVYLNTGFGTGTFAGVKIFDGDLKDFELADYLVKTSVLSLQKGVSNSGAVVLYNTSFAKGCRVTIVSKSSVGKKSMVEYNVIDNGTDVFHNEFGSLNTSADGFTALFDITPGNETRITLTLSDDHATNDTVEITVLTQVVK